MSDNPGRKADLDKEGITFADSGKAELDKEGIPLDPDEGTNDPVEGAESSQETKEEKPQEKKRLSLMLMKNKRLTLALIGGSVGLVLLFSIGGVVLYHALTDAPAKPAKEVKPKEDPTFGPDGGMLIDPFMVFYDTHDSRSTGVLIAQVSLHVNPEEVLNIESRLFDIRNIIFNKLSSTVNVYSETEIEKMLSEDLQTFHVNDVAFTQFQKR